MSTLTCEKSVGTALLMQALVVVTALAGLPGNRNTRPLTATTSPAINTARLSVRTLMSILPRRPLIVSTVCAAGVAWPTPAAER